MPRLLRDVTPQYTAEAMGVRIEGTVWVDVVVLPTGEVGDVTVTKSLDQVYASTSRQWPQRNSGCSRPAGGTASRSRPSCPSSCSSTSDRRQSAAQRGTVDDSVPDPHDSSRCRRRRKVPRRPWANREVLQACRPASPRSLLELGHGGPPARRSAQSAASSTSPARRHSAVLAGRSPVGRGYRRCRVAGGRGAPGVRCRPRRRTGGGVLRPVLALECWFQCSVRWLRKLHSINNLQAGPCACPTGRPTLPGPLRRVMHRDRFGVRSLASRSRYCVFNSSAVILQPRGGVQALFAQGRSSAGIVASQLGNRGPSHSSSALIFGSFHLRLAIVDGDRCV